MPHASRDSRPRIHPELKRRCEPIRRLLHASDLGRVRGRFELGRLVAQAINEAQFGDDPVGQIKAELGIGRRTLYRFAAIAGDWPDHELEPLMSRLNAFGLPLTWSHFVVLGDAQPAPRRKGLADQALRHGWNAVQLHRRIHGKALRVVGGEPRDPLAAGTRRLRARAESLLGSLSTWERHLAHALSSQERSAEAVRSLREARKTYEQLRLTLDKVLGRIEAGLSR